jgi:hypothetical protein
LVQVFYSCNIFFCEGGDVKNIEAWLMQTDGDSHMLAADFQSPSPDDLAAISFTSEITGTSIQNSTSNETLDNNIACSVLASSERQEASAVFENEIARSAILSSVIESQPNFSSEQLASVELSNGTLNSDSVVAAQAASSELFGYNGDQNDSFGTGTGSQLNSGGNVSKMTAQAESKSSVSDDPVNIGDEDYVDERQLMEYLRQLEMERSEELLLEAASVSETSSCYQEPVDSSGTGARPKVNNFVT